VSYGRAVAFYQPLAAFYGIAVDVYRFAVVRYRELVMPYGVSVGRYMGAVMCQKGAFGGRFSLNTA